MWGGEKLYSTRLAQLLDAFHVASMGIVLGMCYSGGFIDDLRRENRVIATSCTGSEQSWACRDRPYDEFVYHWTCAMAGHDTEGNAVNADTDGDGYVSLDEAFNYAWKNDRREETPQYSSTPVALGEQWSLAPKQGSGMNDIPMVNGKWTNGKSYDLQGRNIPITRRKHLKKFNAKQSFRRSPIIIIEP